MCRTQTSKYTVGLSSLRFFYARAKENRMSDGKIWGYDWFETYAGKILSAVDKRRGKKATEGMDLIYDLSNPPTPLPDYIELEDGSQHHPSRLRPIRSDDNVLPGVDETDKG